MNRCHAGPRHARGARILLVLVVPMLLLAPAASVVRAQQRDAGSDLESAAELTIGRAVTASIEGDAPRYAQRGGFHLYRFNAAAGDRLAIVMRSNAFDAYLTVGDRSSGIFDAIEQNDDGGRDTDARLRFTAPRTGTYYVLAQSLAGNGAGTYTLALESLPEPEPLHPVPVALGDRVDGTLSDTDAIMEADNSSYDLYTFEGTAGDRVRITMRSGALDAYLQFGHWREGEFEPIGADDDGASGTDAAILATLPASGTYAVLANSYDPDGRGAYVLDLEQRPEPASIETHPIAFDETVNGALEATDAILEDDSYFDVYTFDAQAGDRVIITLRTADFDAFAALGTVEDGEFQAIATDDDGAADTNALIAVVLSESGSYVIRANSLGPGETGAYTLTLER